MKVNSIYPMIQGEGTNAGGVQIMLRLQGCPLRCNFCDTAYAQDINSGTEMTVDDIARALHKHKNIKWLDISGGEPLLQATELAELIILAQGKYRIEVETSGFLPPPGWWAFVTTWVVDWKTPSSGVESKAIGKWKKILTYKDSIKFVVQDEYDLTFAKKKARSIEKPTVLVSPVIWDIKENDGGITIGKEQFEWMRKVAQFCQENNFRLSLQQHKLLWGEKKDV